MKTPKQAHVANTKPSGDWHTSHTSMGMGDYYGTGVRAKLGRIRDGTGMNPLPKSKIKTPPTSVA